MLPAYIRGEIFSDEFFQYPGTEERCDKLLLVLNKKYTQGDKVVLVPAATNKINLPYKNGCNHLEKIHYFEKQIGYYRDKTIIQYEFIDYISEEEFETRIKLNEMKRQGKSVTDAELADILSCMKSLKEDIPEEAYNLVF